MQFNNLSAQYEECKQEIDGAISMVLQHGKYILGPEVDELEEKLAQYVEVKHCVTCANGTDALVLPLMAWGIGEGDAVFVPSFTFVATAEAVALVGATPVFCDINLSDYNLCKKSLREKIEQVKKDGKLQPRAIIPVDLFGLPADYDAICEIANQFDLLVLEDGAQSFGGSKAHDANSSNGCKTKKCCSFGNAAATSFFPAKPLGCYGDGGAIFTNDDHLAELLRSLRFHGKGSDKYDNIRVGINSRLDTIQAAILLVKLTKLDEEIEYKNSVAEKYNSELCSLPVVLSQINDSYTSAWAQYTILLPENVDRTSVIKKLSDKGIPSMVYYPKPLHLQTVFKTHAADGSNGCEQDISLPNSETAAKRVLSLPMSGYITMQEQDAVIAVLKEILS